MLAFSHQAESRIYKENDEDTCTSDWRNIRTKHSVVKAEAAVCVESDGIHPLDLKESSPKNEIWVIIYSPQYRWKDRWRWVVDKTFLQFHRKNTFLYTTQADGDYTFFLINYSFNTATYQFGDCWLNKKEDMEQVTLQKTDQRHFSVTSFLDFLRKKNVWNQFRLFVLNKSDNAKVVLFWATLY